MTVTVPTPGGSRGIYDDIINDALGSITGGVFYATDYGAVADGATDNAAAFTALAAAVNAVPNTDGTPVTVAFPGSDTASRYSYSDGLTFTRPVTLRGTATLDYTGTGYAVKLGPDGLTDSTYTNHKHYEVHGLTFTGGASYTHGIYVNDHIVAPVLDTVRFRSFGNATGYAVFFQADNWFSLMERCQWFTPSGSAPRNWVKTHGFSTGGVWDGGACRLVMSRCTGANLAGRGVGVWVNGYDSQIERSVIEGFGPCVRVGPRALATVLESNYFETINITDSDCIIEYGDVTGGVDAALHVNNIKVLNNYANVHNTDAINIDAYFMGQTQSGAGLQNARIENNHILSNDAGREMVRQSTTKAGQTGNTARGNYGPPIVHTTGGSVAAWRSDTYTATSVATVVGARPAYDEAGNLLGYMPIYSSYS